MAVRTDAGVINPAFFADIADSSSGDEHILVESGIKPDGEHNHTASSSPDTESNISTQSSSSTQPATADHDENSSFHLAFDNRAADGRKPFSSLASEDQLNNENNVQTHKGMQPSSRKYEAGEMVSSISNGNTTTNGRPEIIEKRSSQASNGFTKEYIIPKAYYRDVRLSLDGSKPTSNDPFSGKNYCARCSYEDSTTVTSVDGSSCDSCRSKGLKYYKLARQYIVERPLFCFSVWSMFYIFWGSSALPGGSLFALCVLELAAIFLGYVAEILQLPALLGMMAAGFILRNVPYIDVAKDLDLSVSSPFRGVSIVILLIRGGLGVNAVNIAKFKNIVPSLVIGSCIMEAVAASVAIYLIIGFSAERAALMGSILSAMSGVAVLPYLASTEKQLSLKADPCLCTPNYQSAIAIARTGCGLDAMIAICLAEFALGFVFVEVEGDVGQGLLRGVVEVGMGGVFGVIWGFAAGWLLDETSSHEKRTITVLACGVMSLLGFSKVGYPRGGPLAVFAGVVIVAAIWRKNSVGGNNNEQLSASFTQIWFVFQPLLFSIIGARTDLSQVDWTFIGQGMICLAIGLCLRLFTSFMMTSWGKLSLRERLYVCISWIPKGTVQAALGPVVLDTASSAKNLNPDIDYTEFGNKVMNLSAASVIAAATVGCLLLRFVGPRLLVQK